MPRGAHDWYSPEQYEEVRIIAVELGDRCKRAEKSRDEMHDQVQKLLNQRDELIRECKALKNELASRNGNEGEDNRGVWIVQVKRRGTRTWKECGNPEVGLEMARQQVDYMQFKSGSGQGEEWRAIRADGMIYWPLWTKIKAPK